MKPKPGELIYLVDLRLAPFCEEAHADVISAARRALEVMIDCGVKVAIQSRGDGLALIIETDPRSLRSSL